MGTDAEELSVGDRVVNQLLDRGEGTVTEVRSGSLIVKWDKYPDFEFCYPLEIAADELIKV